MAVSTPYSNSNGTVYVYDNTPNLLQTITIGTSDAIIIDDTTTTTSGFGNIVKFNENETLFISDLTYNSNIGAIYVLDKSVSTWIQSSSIPNSRIDPDSSSYT